MAVCQRDARHENDGVRMILMKSIKPKRMKVDALRLELLTKLNKVARDIKKDFEKTTETWERKVEFEVLKSLKGGPSLMIATDDEIYGYVNNGTKPHMIWAGIYTGKSTAKVLAFPGTYTAKTMPGVIGSNPGGSSGKMIFRPYVHHPGTKARHFDRTIRDKWRSNYKRRMEGAMRRAAEKSGHAI